MTIGAFKRSSIKSIYSTISKLTLDLKRPEILLRYASRLARGINNLASLNNTTLEKLKTQNYIQTLQIIKRENTIISSPWTNTFNISTKLNALFKENTSPDSCKSIFKSIFESYKEFQRHTESFKSYQEVRISIVKNILQPSFKLPICSICAFESITIYYMKLKI